MADERPVYVLLRHTMSTLFRPEDVYRLKFGDDDTVIAFSDGQFAADFVTVAAERGTHLFRHGLPDNHTWTTLLGAVQKLGATHVAIDPRSTDPERRPIGVVILDFDLLN